MNNLDILIPFGLPPAEMAADLRRALVAPSYATMLARSKSVKETDMDAFSRTLPHEKWAATQFGLADKDPANSPPIARTAMQRLGIRGESGFWFLLQPAHLHVARDHLVLTDLRKLVLSENESQTLFQSVETLFEEDGKELVFGDAKTWFLRADDWADFLTSTPDAASGHNIDIWMPRGQGEREWRKLLNEVQMTWHMHPLNTERESRGDPAVNSLWLWGGTHERTPDSRSRYQHIVSPLPWMPSSEQTFESYASVTGLLDTSTSSALLVMDDLMDAAMASDWSTWLDNMHRLENEWMSPLLEALRSGKIDEIRFILSHGTKLLEVASGKNSVKKFWIKPSLATLSR